MTLKKLLFVFSIVLLVFTLSACTLDSNDEPSNNNDDNQNDIPTNGEAHDDLNDNDGEYDLQRFETVLNYLETYHYQGASSEALIEAAIYGLFNGLDDPYSSYQTQEEVERLQNTMEESFVGIGVTVENINNSPVIRSVFENSPAMRTGLLNGDLISHVDGENLRGQGLIPVMLAIMGEEGTEVEIGVDRPGVSETLYFTMTREEIDNPTIEYEMVEEANQSIGYIRINSFGSETASRFNQALQTLETEGLDGLVVDVRNNGGGFLTAVLNILRLFLVDDGEPMFSIREFEDGVPSEPSHFYGLLDQQKPYEIVTLINDFSASASEVFASAMQEQGGYEVVGVDSLGKGTMQYTYKPDILEGDEIRISRGQWLTSSGTWVNNIGGDIPSVSPTIEETPDPIFTLGSLYFKSDETFTYDTVDLRIIKPMQIMLNTLEFGDIRSDGYFDHETLNALEAFQTAHDLPSDGVLDIDTAQALNEAMFDYRSDVLHDNMFTTALRYLVDHE